MELCLRLTAAALLLAQALPQTLPPNATDLPGRTIDWKWFRGLPNNVLGTPAQSAEEPQAGDQEPDGEGAAPIGAANGSPFGSVAFSSGEDEDTQEGNVDAPREGMTVVGTPMQPSPATETGAEANAETDTEANAETGMEAKTETDAEANAETGAEAETENGTEANTETGAEAETENGTEANTETGAEAETENGTEANTETGADANREADAETEAETNMETNAETDAETNAETDAETGAETDAEANASSTAAAPSNATVNEMNPDESTSTNATVNEMNPDESTSTNATELEGTSLGPETNESAADRDAKDGAQSPDVTSETTSGSPAVSDTTAAEAEAEPGAPEPGAPEPTPPEPTPPEPTPPEPTVDESVPVTVASVPPRTTQESNATDRDMASGESNTERGLASSSNGNNRKHEAWAAILGTAVAVCVIALVVFVILKKKNQTDFSHRKLVEFSPDPVLRLDNSEPLESNYGNGAYYNPALQMTSIPTQYSTPVQDGFLD